MKKLFDLIMLFVVEMLLTVRAFTLFALALLLAACGFAFAQDSAPAVGSVVVPDSVWTLAAVVIGWIVQEISSPLTALLKARFGFQGSVTRYVYLVLSVFFVAGFGLVTHAFASGPAGWWAALGAVATALVKGFGGYTRLQQASASALPPITVTAVNPAPAQTGLEDLK